MTTPPDIEIARKVKPRPPLELARELGIAEEDVIPYGFDKAKVHFRAIEKAGREPGKLVLVSAITPTAAGEGKTTVSIGLAQGLKKIGTRACLALREPSMGPLFGMKGGATGGGYSQVIPMEDINLLFTGDFPAITAAHNLLLAALDNAMHFRTLPQVDPRRIRLPRVIDMNDRALRKVILGLGGRAMGVPREAGFEITAASEVMAILALSRDYHDLRNRLERILVALTYDGEPITAGALKVAGSMMAILRDAIHPNLVQSLEGVPAFVHCGPFANIAHGSNSILATRMAMAHADVTVTEAGFGFDLGAEKFLDITCRAGGFSPAACVLVVTARALKLHGGVREKDLDCPDPAAVIRGLPNMQKHLENIAKFHVPVVVAINRFDKDSPEELEAIEAACKKLEIPAAVADIHARGGEGGVDLAEQVMQLIRAPFKAHRPLYELEWTVERKIETIAKEVYGSEHVDFTADAKKDLRTIERLGHAGLAVCVAKTQKSLSDNPALLGRPKDFIVTVRNLEIAAGAGFLVALAGDIMRMPGLPKQPAYQGIDLLPDGTMVGLS